MEATEQRWIIFFGEWMEWDLDSQLEAPEIIWTVIPKPVYAGAACPVCGEEFAHIIGCPAT